MLVKALLGTRTLFPPRPYTHTPIFYWSKQVTWPNPKSVGERLYNPLARRGSEEVGTVIQSIIVARIYIALILCQALFQAME